MASNWVGRSTFPDPDSIPVGPAIYVNTNAMLSIQASIIGPHSSAPAVNGSVADFGFNLSADATPEFSAPSSVNNTDPLFVYPEGATAPLLELRDRSPGINRVPLQLTPIDARGFRRPFIGSDSGAIEMKAPFAAITAITPDNKIEIRLGLFGHPLKVESTTDFLTWREVDSTETNSYGEQVFDPPLNEALIFFRFKEN